MTLYYDQYRDQLKTGDILLFSGRGWFSTMVRMTTNSEFSHVGMVIKDDRWDFLTIWESTKDHSLLDLESGNFSCGVQLFPLSRRLETYDGDVYFRPLEGVTVDEGMIAELAELRRQLKGRSFERDWGELFLAAKDFGFIKDNTEDLSSLFCAELVAEAYQAMGLLRRNEDGGLASNEYTPANFSEKGKLTLLKGSLGMAHCLKKFGKG